MGKYGVNVPKGVAASSLEEVKKAIQEVFPNESEVSIVIWTTFVRDLILSSIISCCLIERVSFSCDTVGC